MARGLGSSVAALWALIGVSEIAFPHTPPSPEAELQGTILVILGITVILGVLLAWSLRSAYRPRPARAA